MRCTNESYGGNACASNVKADCSLEPSSPCGLTCTSSPGPARGGQQLPFKLCEFCRAVSVAGTENACVPSVGQDERMSPVPLSVCHATRMGRVGCCFALFFCVFAISSSIALIFSTVVILADSLSLWYCCCSPYTSWSVCCLVLVCADCGTSDASFLSFGRGSRCKPMVMANFVHRPLDYLTANEFKLFKNDLDFTTLKIDK